MSFQKPLPKASVLRLLVILTGAVAIAVAAANQIQVPEYMWLTMIALALFAGPMGTINIPAVYASVTPGDAVTFACAALFGPSAGVLAAAADGLGTSLRVTRSRRKFAYNVAMCAVSMAGASLATRAAFPQFGIRTLEMPAGELVVSLGLFAICYFIISTSLVAAYIAVSSHQSFSKVWTEDFLWTSISYIFSGASALGVCLLVERFGYYSFLVPVVLIMFVYLFYRSYFQKVASANLRADSFEEQLRQAQKMEAVGRLAGGVAHDFNNLLTAIMGYSELLLTSLDEHDPLRKHIEEIGKAGERAASLTRQLLAFSRKQMLKPEVLDLNSVVSDMGKMLGRLIGEDVELITNPEPALGRVKADPGQIEQVIMNLAVNARDAMPRGGKLIIETANVYLDENYTSGRVNVQPGPYVMLAITDTGCGMDKDTMSNIFEPFFTTKEKGKGTGLGLSTVYGIVYQSGGDIQVESDLGKGTSFKIFLPQVEDPGEVIKSNDALPDGQSSSETILLVEDEDVVRNLVRDTLRINGYAVIEAANGIEALQICRTHRGSIDLLVTDVVMPQMSGREVAERLAVMRPETKVLYVSGYTEDAMVHHGVSHEGMNFLQKPFTPRALARKVREVLGEPGKSRASHRREPHTLISNRGQHTADPTKPSNDSSRTIH